MRKTGIWALDTLGEDETIARLATGVKRFKLPDDHNFIKLYQQVAATIKRKANANDTELELPAQSRPALRKPPPVPARRRILATGDRTLDRRRARRFATGGSIKIVGNWGQFESVMSQPAGRGATVDFRFRNAKQVEFVAHEINVRKLLDRCEGLSQDASPSSSIGSR